ncbi:helix-turn-helix transcriptional regulator (plasmid) [Candidatus Arsenophonus nilaparvatae]|uniref:helix-turn-helix transcriptional regulator n=1 Tax=Candidatus Arsenophonus nilaparvatae TaxID=1247023 RepID=UPI0037C01912
MTNNENDLKKYISSPQSLISFMEHSQAFWGIKDLDSKWIYANNSSLDFYRIEKGFNIEGKLDSEIPMPSQEISEDLVRADQDCMNRKKRITSIEIHYYGKNNIDTPIPSLCYKSPLYDDNENIIGVIWHGEKINAPELLYYMDRLNRNTIQFDAPNDLFTKRELEVIFWAQQRLGIKEIARRLDIVPQTVEVHIKNIYRKADVHNSIQLVEYCKHEGLDRYIPADFIRKGVQIMA